MQKLIFVAMLVLVGFNSYADNRGESDGDTTKHVNFNGIFPEVFDNTPESEEPQSVEAHIGAVQGTVEQITGTGFRYIILVDKEGKRHKLLWIHNFDGSELLSQSHALIGKKVSIEYQPLKCYMPKEHVFVMMPQMRGLSLIE